ncbi:MAG TPA: hypothetical protein VFT16_01055 [Candidatus Saccharimonadales bacterium]|nr:hypothetical protein [Candidatus Saccharimonadales bacterium]
MFHKKNTQPAGRVRTAQPSRSARGPVFSYYANRTVRAGSTARDIEEPIRQESPRTKRKPGLTRRLPALASLLAVLMLTGAVLQLGDKPKISVVGSDSQLFLRDRTVYEVAAQKSFTSFMNSNKLTVNPGKISADLQKQFPELKVVSVSLPVVGSQPIVFIQPAAPKVIIVGKGGMYVLSGDGRALIAGNQVPNLDELKIPVVNDHSGLEISLGKIVLPQGTVAFITEVAGQMESKGLKVAALELPAASNELHMRLDGVGYFIKFNLHGRAREQAGSYLAVKDYLESADKMPGEYVDVRVENRAYYK